MGLPLAVYLLSFLGKTLEFVNTYAMLILVIITGFYAWATYRMAKIMKGQVVPNIQISNIKVGTNIVEEYFQKSLKEEKNIERIILKLSFNIANENAGAGSIEKPNLILRFKNHTVEYEFEPLTKSNKFIRQNGPFAEYDEINSGKTIFLKGGDSQNIELKYPTSRDLEKDKKIIEKLKEGDLLEYSIKYKDNFRKKHRIKIKDIGPERDFFRV